MRSLAGNGAGKQLVGKQQSLDVGGELGQQALGPVLSGTAEEYCPELQPAADGLFHNAHAFDGAITVGREFAMSEGRAQLLDQGVVASLDASQTG